MSSSRAYKSATRARSAAQTRQRVLTSARTLFLQKGYAASTIASIARHAKVSPETIYSTFGTKTALVLALVENALRGAEPSRPILEQGRAVSILAEPDPVRRIARFAADITEVLERVAPLVEVLRAAAATDPECAATYADIQENRLRVMTRVAGPLFAGTPVAQAQTDVAASLWRLTSPELFLLVTRVEARSPGDFANWLEEMLGTVARSR